MPSFRDSNGREWLVRVDVWTIEEVRDATGVNLYGLFAEEMKALGELLSDPVRLVKVLYLVCREEAEKSGVDARQFGRGIAGDALGAAGMALMRGVIDFFPEPQRSTLRKWLSLVERASEIAGERAGEELGGIGPEQILDLMGDWRSRSSGGSPDNSGSTPPGSPSESSP